MADPATLGMVVRAAVATLSDERLRKTAGWIVAAILSPLILIVVILCGLLAGTASHNTAAVTLCFKGGTIPSSVPAEYRSYIEAMRSSFYDIDNAISAVDQQMENGDRLDSTRVKAIFYALYFGSDTLPSVDYSHYVDCFVIYEQRTRTHTDADGSTHTETYTVAVPIQDLATIYVNVAAFTDMTVGTDAQTNASEIYYRILYGVPAPTDEDTEDAQPDTPTADETPMVGANGFGSPLGSNWRSVVTSEFSYRTDPITGKTKMHSGIDLGMPRGTPIHAAMAGTVRTVAYSATGYGYHVIIDHGNGLMTVYAHCSKILVTEGQHVAAGAVIAEVGSTGRSTGNHLHFEVRVNGTKINPRNYLP